jgi:TfoX/Sxy family transcriptional regulator of competence genes
MAYDEDLAELVRMELGGDPELTERKMFGGIGFMVRGNMAVGVSGTELMVRVGPEAHDDAVAVEGVRIFDGGARPMRGWVLVDPAVVGGDALGDWIERGRAFASGLPAK